MISLRSLKIHIAMKVFRFTDASLKIILLGCVVVCGGYWIYLGSTVQDTRKWWLSKRDRKYMQNGVIRSALPWNSSVLFEFEGANKTHLAKMLQSETRLPKICVAVHNMGRLGNRIFQVAGLLGIARDKEMRPFLETDNELLAIFQLPNVEVLLPGQCDLFPVHNDLRARACDPETYNFSRKRNIQIKGYFQSWKYFRNITTFIRRQFQIRSPIKHEAKIVLVQTLLFQRFSLDRLRTSTLVAVHVRRGDMVGSDANTAPPSYLEHATKYFRDRFKNVLFVAGSDDITWTMKHLPHNDTVFLRGNRAELDFVILSMCDHTIMTIGTYGWWVAWLANGITTYYKYPHVMNSGLASMTVMDDYIPRDWIGLA